MSAAGSADADSAAFEAAVERAVGARPRPDEAACSEVWSALANIRWRRADVGEVACSFRRASRPVADVRGRDHEPGWHCSGPVAAAGNEIEAATAREGWTPEPRAD